MTYLITGGSGFVAPYMARCIREREGDAEIVSVARQPEGGHRGLDLADRNATALLIKDVRPDYLIHLASSSSVSYSWQSPIEAFTNNTNIFLNVIESVRLHSPHTRVLSVGSSEQYGTVKEVDCPLQEERELKPNSPYAVARVAQEQLSSLYARSFGLDIVMTRSFNHLGRGQSTRFAVPAFILKMKQAKANRESSISVGNLDIVRDFSDVRDVVSAYYLLLKRGQSGKAYNVCSGVGHRLLNIIDLIGSVIGYRPRAIRDESLVRPSDAEVIVGSNTQIKEELGWHMTYSVQDSIMEMSL